MNNTNSLIRIAVSALFTFAIVLSSSLIAGISFRELVVEIVVYGFYGLLVIAYVLRFALIFLGVFAVYRMLHERQSRRLTA